jgi:4-amino-4-deoxy-L-arabinose transferase-like glycosyltransferase
MQNRWVVILLLSVIFSLGLLIRIQYIETTIIPNPIIADARQYVTYGYNILTHGIYSKELSDSPKPDSFRSPGYPIIIVAAMYFGGDKGYYQLIIITQVIISSLLVLLTFFIGIRFMHFFYALVAAFFVAINPHLISISSYILTETFFSFFLLLSTLCIIIALQKRRLLLFLLAALLFGYTYFINETALLIPFLFAVLWVNKIRVRSKGLERKKLLYKLIQFFLIFSLFPAGWIIRNYISLPPGSPTGNSRLVSTMSHGAYPGFIYQDPKYKYFPYREDPMQPEFGSSLHSFTKILWTRFKGNPVRYISWYVFEKPYYLWSWNILQGQGDIYIYPVTTSLYLVNNSANLSREMVKFFHPVFLGLSLIGAIFLIFSKKDSIPGRVSAYDFAIFPFIICIYYTVIYTISASWPRYSVPLRPELYLCAIWCINTIVQNFTKNKNSTFIKNPT